MRLVKLIPLLLLAFLVSCADKYKEGFNTGREQGYTEGYNVGYGEGQADGDAAGYERARAYFETAGYNEGFADGSSVGHSSGYWNGYTVGKNETYQGAYEEGYADGEIDGYNLGEVDGYNLGYSDGYDEGYHDRYDPVFESGYAAGYSDGEYDGYSDGYDDGEIDGYHSGYYDGDADGYSDGYDIGYTDGFYDGYDDGSWGLSIGKTKKLQGYANIISLAHNDIFDYSKIKAPRETKRGLMAQGKLLLSETSLTNKDTLKRAAVVEQYVVMEMAKQVKGKFGLSAERSLKIAKAANHFRKYSSKRALTADDTNAYAEEIIGSDFKAIEKAFEKSLAGDVSGFNSVLDKAAEKNGTSPENIGVIITKFFL